MKKSSDNVNKGNGHTVRSKSYRFFVLAGSFIVIMLVFTVLLAINQIKGTSGKYTSEGLITRVETVAGERGRIYDRNGKLLVGNASHYDLVFEYGSMPDRRAEVNDSLLECLIALEKTGNSAKRTESYFPLVRTADGYVFSEDTADLSSKIGYYYQRFLKDNGLDSDVGADKIVERFIKKYKLTSRLYSDDAIYELMRIYYDMECVGFGYYQSYTIAKGFEISVPQEMALISYIEEHRTPGATLLRSSERVYMYGDYAGHILGTRGKITAENADRYKDYPLDALVGISGCESVFEEYLRGVNGKKISKYDADGNLVEQYYDPAPVIGNDIFLTIDIDMQISAEDELRDAVEKLDSSKTGALTAIDPRNGEAIVIASYSTESSMNFALQGTFAPGSTYKVGSALAALEEGYISSSTTHVCNRVYPYLGGPTCLGNHGEIDVSDAIRVSCNIYFYYLGHGWGIDNITKYTSRLGLGVPTGIELGERVGTIASEQYCRDHELEWSAFDNATGAIGQSKHAYTPLQLSVYMSTISNGGTRYSAHILKSVRTRAGESVYESAPEVLDNINISDGTYSLLVRAMRSVITSNTALSGYFGNVPGEVAGKTGTAETGREISNALFSGFAPYDDPQIVVSCVLEEGEAGTNAAAVTAKVFEKYFSSHEEN